MQKYSKYIFSGTVLIIFLLFFIKANVSLDPDFGWRLRSGQIYLTQGIPETDSFTYTMPDFPWVDHAWLQSTIIGFLYPYIGHVGLSVIIALLGGVALIFASGSVGVNIVSRSKRGLKQNNSNLKIIPMILGFPFLLSFIGIRAQIVTWVFFSLLIKLYFHKALWNRFRSYLPLYFLVWANVHGGVVAGLIFVTITLITKAMKEKKLIFDNILIVIFCFVSTLFTPYAFGTWREIFSSTFDSTLRWTIAEWKPTIFLFDIPLWFLVVFSISCIYFQRKKVEFEWLVLYVFFFIQGLISRRNMPFWILLSIPMTSIYLRELLNEVIKIKDGRRKLTLISKPFITGVIFIVLFQTAMNLWGATTISEKRYYPSGAVIYLKDNLPEGEVFSDYGWGGYLIWKLPEKKVFIDGRMPSWKWSANDPKQSNSAIEEYIDVFSGNIDHKNLFSKYGIDTVLLQKPPSVGFIDSLAKKIANTFAGIRKNTDKEFNLLDELKNEGWKQTYYDSRSIVLRKN